MTENKTYGIMLREKELDGALTREEVTELFDGLNGLSAIPVEFQGEFGAAMGFINLTDAELIDYEYGPDTELYNFIKSILDDMEEETPTGEYVFRSERADIDIKILRGEE